MALISSPPHPGQIVRVRQRQYLVEEIVQPPQPDEATLVRLSCVDDDAQGQPLEVLWENEVDPEILTGESWQALASRGFDPPRLFSAYLHTLRWNCVTATNPRLFQSPFRAGIRIDAYQLEPLRKALLLPRVNLFIADDVGLGKTIEAGLIARELLLRKKVREIVVAAPPSMLQQWKDELENRFGLLFEILDRGYISRVRQQRGFGVNPWSTHTRFLISHRLLIDEDYAGPLRNHLGEFRPGALLILDEAHHAAPASGQRYAIDSKITRAIRELAPHFEHRLFLSATPHNGHSNSFSALLEILDPQRFCRGVPVEPALRDEVVVRRLKEDIREISGGFPRRTVLQVDIDDLPADDPELRLTALLDEYRKLRERRLSTETKRRQAEGALLISGLQQRLFSSVEAFARTLRVHRRTVLRHWEAAAGDRDREREADLDLLNAPVGSDDDRAALSEEENRADEEAQIAASTAATAAPADAPDARALFAQEQRLLDEMAEIADAARGAPTARIRALVDWIRSRMCPLGAGAKWNDTRLLIFTEWDDTKRYLHEQLAAAIAGTDRAAERIAIFHGPTPDDEREEIKRAFNGDPARYPIRILIATDAAREGINLQTRCHNLFHFDIPWNPSRMEQRSGRIDRKLQSEPEVFCHYFFYRQRPEDRILRTVVRKIETAKKELGSVSQVVEGRIAERLSHGIPRDTIDELEREIETEEIEEERRRATERELEEARDRRQKLGEQVERCRTLLADSRDWIRLEEDHFRATISAALEVMGAPPLERRPDTAPVDRGDGHLPRYAFPAIDQASGADPTWADTLDSLRAPRPRDQRLWEWRRSSPIRPIIFADPGTMDETVVHLHLEHRVVQRLLGRFRSQGFVHNDLTRACLAQSRDPIPRVILLGRLCLYGPNAARLHEELIPVAARWVDPQQRKGPLAPYKQDAETLTLDLLEKALLPASGAAIGKTVQANLQGSGPRDVEELRPYLEERGRAVAGKARHLLAERGKREAEAMAKILTQQRERIAAAGKKAADPQQRLALTEEEELRQLEADRRHWDRRLADIDQELLREPARIEALYEVKAQRIEPVGLVYLWPVTG